MAFHSLVLFAMLAVTGCMVSPHSLPGNAGAVDLQKCLICMCLKANNCQQLACDMLPTPPGFKYGRSQSTNNETIDVKHRCGYFYISVDEYKHLKPSTNIDFFNCAKNYQCAIDAIQAYVNANRQYCPNATNECERMSRLHLGGPAGCYSSLTSPYWGAVRQCLQEKEWKSTGSFISFMRSVKTMELAVKSIVKRSDEKEEHSNNK